MESRKRLHLESWETRDTTITANIRGSFQPTLLYYALNLKDRFQLFQLAHPDLPETPNSPEKGLFFLSGLPVLSDVRNFSGGKNRPLACTNQCTVLLRVQC